MPKEDAMAAELSDRALKQYGNKNAMLDEIATILGLQVHRLRARKMIVELLQFRGRNVETADILDVLEEIKKNGIVRWSQFSPYLSGEKDWAKN
jgi:hypothetical protein